MTEISYTNGASRSGTRSTRGASKQRRALINQEIDQLKLQLPISTITKQRLFQLQVMALACAYVRKYWFTNTVLPNVYSSCLETARVNKWPFYYAQHSDEENIFERALRNLIVLVNQYGKAIYLAGNVAEILGRNTEDIIAHADNVYDWIDSADHGCLQMALTCTRNSAVCAAELDQILVCRLQPLTSGKRSAQEQSLIVHCRHFHAERAISAEHELGEGQKRTQPVFALDCRVLLNVENIENTYFGTADIFHTLHEMNMQIITADNTTFKHIGIAADELSGISWFTLLHPQDVAEAAFKHRLPFSLRWKRTVLLLSVALHHWERRTPMGPLYTYSETKATADNRFNDRVNISETEAAVLRSKDYLYRAQNFYLDSLVCYPSQTMIHQFNNPIFMDPELYTSEAYHSSHLGSSQLPHCIELDAKADRRHDEQELCHNMINCNHVKNDASLLLQSDAASYYY